MKIISYSSLLILYINEILIYKVKIILLTLSQFASPLIMMVILSNIPSTKTTGMSSSEIINYYIYTSLLFLFLSSKVDTFVGKSVIDGTLSTFLLKPLHFWIVALAGDFSARFVKLFIGLPIILFLLIINKEIIKIDLNNLPLIILSIVIGYTLSFLISFSVGLLAFFLEEVWGIQNLKEVTILLLGGIALPYNFFPNSLQNFLHYTPFPYLINWSTRLGFSGNVSFEIFIATTWLFILFLICKLLWFAGIKKYSGIGTF